MNRKLILLVEDNPGQVELFIDAVTDWNRQNEDSQRQFVTHVATDAAEATRMINEVRIDCALTDLSLPAMADGKASTEIGSRLATQLLQKRGIPLAIVSGFPDDVAAELIDRGTVGIFTKDEAYEDALAWLASQWSMMEALSTARKKIEESTGDVFLKRIWPQWKEFEALNHMNAERLAKAISRQYASHTAEHLTHDEEVEWHPVESYVVPSFIDDRAHTGDIFELDDGRWIVMTPQCDMATQKVPNVLLAKCNDDWDGWQQAMEGLKGLSADGEKIKARLNLMALVNQNVPVSQHFLPPLPGEEKAVQIVFSSVRTEPLKTLNSRLDKRLATVSPPFLSNLVQRFGAFVSRTGQPNINVDLF